MFPTDCVRMRGFRKRVLDFVVAFHFVAACVGFPLVFAQLKWISLQRVDFDLQTLDFVNNGGFRGFRFLDPPYRNTNFQLIDREPFPIRLRCAALAQVSSP